MSRLLILLCLLGVLLRPAAAQNDKIWQDGCVQEAIAALENPSLNYAAACETYRSCDLNSNDSEATALCQLRAADVLLTQCAVGDTRCRQTALLYAAAIQAFNMPFGEALQTEIFQTLRENVPLGIARFQQGDDAGALTAFQSVQFDFDYGVMMLPFSRAVIYEALGQPDAALAEYDRIFKVYFSHPLTWYARSQLYGALGRRDEAAFDAAALAEITKNTPELTPLVQTLVDQYPLDATLMQTWLSYPIIGYGGGVGGSFYGDLTQEIPTPVRVGKVENDLYLIGVSRVFGLFEPEEFLRFQRLTPTDTGDYRLTYPEYGENSGSMELQPMGDLLLGKERISYFEGGATIRFILAPQTAPDPRSNINGQRACPQGVISRAKPGMIVVTPRHFEGMFYYDAPAGTAIQQVEEMRLIAGPTCIHNVAWWQGQDAAGNVGWLPENEDSGYLFNIKAGNNSLLYCPNTPLARLYVGGQGSVAAGLGANNLRATASLSGAVIGQIPENGIFTVVEGAVCADGFLWWQVDYEGLIGWTAEGTGADYWLNPR